MIRFARRILNLRPHFSITERKTYDWRSQYNLVPFDAGQRVSLVCWSGHGRIPREDDYLILRSAGNPDGTRYRVTEVERALAEGDVVTVRAVFAPRPAKDTP